MKKLYTILLSSLILASCSVSNDVVSKHRIQKRKYAKGYSNNFSFMAFNGLKNNNNLYASKDKVHSNQITRKKLIDVNISNSNSEYKNTIRELRQERISNLYKTFKNRKKSIKLPGKKVKLKSGTMIELETVDNINSKSVGQGQDVMFRVLKDVEVDDQVVIEGGSTAYGKVTERSKAKGLGKPGELSVRVERVMAVDGTTIYVSGDNLNREGEDKKGVAIAYIVIGLFLLGLLFWIGFLVKGEEAIIPSGTRTFARTNSSEEIEVD